MNGVSSQRPAGCCTANQKASCLLEKDRVRSSADDIVAERAGIAHRPKLFIGRHVRCRPDTRGRREVSAQFFGGEDSLDFRHETNSHSFSAHDGSESEARMQFRSFSPTR